MPNGYLVTLGDSELGVGDTISGALITFQTDLNLGAGDWEWSGTWGGSTYTNEQEPGVYYLATDGNVYFVPDFGPVDTLTASTVVSSPAYIEGTSGADVIAGDGDAEIIDAQEGNDTVTAGSGDDTVRGGAGDDDISGNAGADEINAGTGNDSVSGGSEADTIEGGGGSDTLEGDSGADVISGGSGSDAIDGGTGDDTIYGDQDPATTSTNETLVWEDVAANNTDVSGGFTVRTGEIDVAVSITNDGALSDALIDATTTQYTEAGEPFDTTSALEIEGNGGADTATIRVDFDAPDDTDYLSQAANISFRINDIDTGTWTDVITVNAFDAGGLPVTVTLTPEGTNFTQTGNTITSAEANGDAEDASGSILVEIAGPASYFEIIYENDNTGGQRMWVTDINFDTVVPADGDDTLTGGTGADDMFGGGGNDLVYVADGDDAYGEEGDDTFILTDLGETNANIFIDGGSGGESAGPGGGDTIQLNGQASLTDVNFDALDPTSGTITLTDGTLVTFNNVENIICFTPGTMIDTPRGPRAIESLRPGDVVLTRDNGPQVVRWTGARTVPGVGDFAPIQLSGAAIPDATAPLLVSPQHRLLFSGYDAELLFGEREVLVAAKHLIDGRDVRAMPCPAVTYIHVMFDRHEIITANGIHTESFYAADQSLEALGDASRDELFQLFPELKFSPNGPTARRALKAYEATLL